MFTSFDKALVAIVMGFLYILNSFGGIDLGFTEEQVAAVIGVLTPIIVYLWPNKQATP